MPFKKQKHKNLMSKNISLNRISLSISNFEAIKNKYDLFKINKRKEMAYGTLKSFGIKNNFTHYDFSGSLFFICKKELCFEHEHAEKVLVDFTDYEKILLSLVLKEELFNYSLEYNETFVNIIDNDIGVFIDGQEGIKNKRGKQQLNTIRIIFLIEKTEQFDITINVQYSIFIKKTIEEIKKENSFKKRSLFKKYDRKLYNAREDGNDSKESHFYVKETEDKLEYFNVKENHKITRHSAIQSLFRILNIIFERENMVFNQNTIELNHYLINNFISEDDYKYEKTIFMDLRVNKENDLNNILQKIDFKNYEIIEKLDNNINNKNAYIIIQNEINKGKYPNNEAITQTIAMLRKNGINGIQRLSMLKSISDVDKIDSLVKKDGTPVPEQTKNTIMNTAKSIFKNVKIELIIKNNFYSFNLSDNNFDFMINLGRNENKNFHYKIFNFDIKNNKITLNEIEDFEFNEEEKQYPTYIKDKRLQKLFESQFKLNKDDFCFIKDDNVYYVKATPLKATVDNKYYQEILLPENLAKQRPNTKGKKPQNISKTNINFKKYLNEQKYLFYKEINNEWLFVDFDFNPNTSMQSKRIYSFSSLNNSDDSFKNYFLKSLYGIKHVKKDKKEEIDLRITSIFVKLIREKLETNTV
jgi:hypothetical protein